MVDSSHLRQAGGQMPFNFISTGFERVLNKPAVEKKRLPVDDGSHPAFQGWFNASGSGGCAV